MFYYFHAKKNYIWKFSGGRPLDDFAILKVEVPLFDKSASVEAFFSEYGDIIEYSSLYEHWFYEPDAIEQIIEHAENSIVRDNIRKEVKKFVENEVTERWFMLYRKYYDPKYTWYS